MELSSLFALAGALPPLLLGLASEDINADENPGFCESTCDKGKPIPSDAKINATWTEWIRSNGSWAGRCAQGV